MIMFISITITDTCGCRDHEKERGEMVGDVDTVGRLHAEKLSQGHSRHHGHPYVYHHHHDHHENDQRHNDHTGAGALSKRNPAEYKSKSVASSLWSKISGWVLV